MVLYFGLRLVLALTTFWWPLLLSVKALHAPDENVLFLLTYWICYASISNLQYHILDFASPIASPLVIAGDLLNMWMFNSHGCLVLTRRYLPRILGVSHIHQFVDMVDKKFIDPLITVFLVRNALLQQILRLLPASVPPLDELLLFNSNLCEHHLRLAKRLPFLQYSLLYFCYIDLEAELDHRHLRTSKSMRRLASSVCAAAATTAEFTKNAVSEEKPSPKGRKLSVGKQDIPHANTIWLWLTAPPARQGSGHVRRNSGTQDAESTPKRVFSTESLRSRRSLGHEEGADGEVLREIRRVVSLPLMSSRNGHATFQTSPIQERRYEAGSPKQKSENIYLRKRQGQGQGHKASDAGAVDPPYPIHSKW